MPRVSVERLQEMRGIIKRKLASAKADKEYQAKWKDELRVIEHKLKDAGVRMRLTK